jgi:hypothetical protein
MVPAKVEQRNLCKPDGTAELAWVVTANEEGGTSTVVFCGVDASARAVAYARARYKPLHFSVMAETGQYINRGMSVGNGAN